MYEIYIFTGLGFLTFILCIISEIFLLIKFKENRNLIYIGLILFLISLQLYAISQIYKFYVKTPLAFGVALTLPIIFWIIVLNLQSIFYFYLKKFRKLYSLPFIIGFFIGAGLILEDNMLPVNIYSALSGFAISFLLINEGFKNKNGLPFSLGLSIIIIGIGFIIDIIVQSDLFRLIFLVIGLIAFNLGMYGFFEKHLFFAKVEMEKIRNTWISKLVIEKERK